MTLNTVITGPFPPFSNPPIMPQYFQPSQFVITAVSLGVVTTITTSVNHNYVLGQQVRLLFPSKYGCSKLNEKTGFVISIPTTNSVVIDTNSVGTDPFIPSPIFLPNQSKTLPQIVAIGDINSGIIATTGRVNSTTNIPGSFINISPL